MVLLDAILSMKVLDRCAVGVTMYCIKNYFPLARYLQYAGCVRPKTVVVGSVSVSCDLARFWSTIALIP